MSNHNFIPFRLSWGTKICLGISTVPMFIGFYRNEPEDLVGQKFAGVLFCLIVGILVDLVFWFARNWNEQ